MYVLQVDGAGDHSGMVIVLYAGRLAGWPCAVTSVWLNRSLERKSNQVVGYDQ